MSKLSIQHLFILLFSLLSYGCSNIEKIDSGTYSNRISIKYTSKQNDVKLPDGSIYSGNFNTRGFPTGQGTLVTKDGSRYKGNFENGRYSGQGILTTNGNTTEAIFFKGLAKKIISIKYPDGTTYRGAYKDQKPHGEGTLKLPNGITLKGQFSGHKSFDRNKMIAIYKAGNTYTGPLDSTLRPHGWGVCKNKGKSKRCHKSRGKDDTKKVGGRKNVHIANKYIGQVWDGIRHGSGSCYLNGVWELCEYKNGSRVDQVFIARARQKSEARRAENQAREASNSVSQCRSLIDYKLKNVQSKLKDKYVNRSRYFGSDYQSCKGRYRDLIKYYKQMGIGPDVGRIASNVKQCTSNSRRDLVSIGENIDSINYKYQSLNCAAYYQQKPNFRDLVKVVRQLVNSVDEMHSVADEIVVAESRDSARRSARFHSEIMSSIASIGSISTEIANIGRETTRLENKAMNQKMRVFELPEMRANTSSGSTYVPQKVDFSKVCRNSGGQWVNNSCRNDAKLAANCNAVAGMEWKSGRCKRKQYQNKTYKFSPIKRDGDKPASSKNNKKKALSQPKVNSVKSTLTINSRRKQQCSKDSIEGDFRVKNTPWTGKKTKIDSLTLRLYMSTFFGEPTRKGVFKWEGTGSAHSINWVAEVLTKDRTKHFVNSHGQRIYVSWSLGTSKEAGKGFGWDTTGSPSWSKAFVTYSAANNTTQFQVTKAEAKALYSACFELGDAWILSIK